MDATFYSKIWDASERTGLAPIEDSLEYLIPLALDPGTAQDGEKFDLYYFVHTPAGPPVSKSVLFCAGGPGQIVRTFDRSNTYVDYLSKNGYNVVFFHLRGSGFSQIPRSTKYDRFLRCEYAVKDMEAIRCHFHEKVIGAKCVKWEAVIGWSFGTVLAQQYAHRFPNSVKKVVLISPISRHRFKESKNAFEEYYAAMLRIYRKTLDEIYTSEKETLQDEFGDLTGTDREKILDALFGKGLKDGGILKDTEDVFGSVQFVIDAYSNLSETFRKHGLRQYSLAFYKSLRDLRFSGSNSIDDTSGIYETQRLIGKTLRDELIGRGTQNGAVANKGFISQNNRRAYYSFGIHDGINWVFLTEHAKGKNIRDAVRAVGGVAQLNSEETQQPNRWLAKLDLDAGKTVKPWDPKDYWHEVPTLILNGEADPVTAGGQAERYYDPERPGAKTLMVFPGIGHNISLGGTEIDKPGIFKARPPLLNGAIHLIPQEIPPEEVREVTGIVRGWTLNANLSMSLEPPQEIGCKIRIHGCGVNSIAYPGAIKVGTENVVALIENTSGDEIVIPDSEWILRTKLFWGTVMFRSLTSMKRDEMRAIYGTMTYGQRSREVEYLVEARKALKRGLTLVGYNLRPPASVELWMRNDSCHAVDQETGDWVIKSANFERQFKVNLPTIESHQTKSVVRGIDGFQIDASEALTVARPTEEEFKRLETLVEMDESFTTIVASTKKLSDKLVACLQRQEEGSRRLSFAVWNQDQSQSQRVDRSVWFIKNSVFTVTVVLDPFELDPGTVSTVKGDAWGIAWVNCLDLKPPNYPEPPLELISYNIKAENEVSMLLRNSSEHSIKGKPRDWIYVIPTSNTNLADLNQALNCLIFSFLVLEPEHFHKREENEILDRILSKFERANLTVAIEHTTGGP